MNNKIDNSQLRKIRLCFFLSGLAALLYQTAWMRQLSVVFGTSELAVATVLTAYMSGLSLGAAIAGKLIHKIKRPLFTYGLLEGGIAISAIAVPYLLIAIGDITSILLGSQIAPPEAKGIGQLIFYFVATLLILVVPTALMGATLPLLSKHVISNEEQIGEQVGGLYSLNTFGAIGGTLIAAFVLLPNISLMNTILVGAAVNLFVLLIIVNLAKSSKEALDVQTKADHDGEKGKVWDKPGSFILPVMTASGIATFTYEVLWTRLISHVLGGSVAAFAVMLAGFLIGIAVGSGIASRYSKTVEQAKWGFSLSQLGIAFAAASTFYIIDRYTPEQGGLFVNSLFSLSILLPSTLFIGATFPFAVRILATSVSDAPIASARVYAWNTVGAIFGAAFAGYFLIPWAKYEGAIQFAVFINLSLAISILYFSKFKASPWLTKVMPAVSVLLFAALYSPSSPKNILTSSPLSKKNEKVKDSNIIFYDVGRSSTVLMTKNKNIFRLRNNGLPEAAISAKERPRSRSSHSILSLLPVIARPDAETMMVAGFGGGVVVEDVAPSIKQIDVLELEPKVIQANKLIAEKRDINPLNDPRVNIIYNDARSALNLTSKKYDVIISQPSHPWTAGASHLYTREYMRLVEEHLEEKGVFLQWMNTSFTDEYLLRSLSATLVDTFKYVRIYQFSPTVWSFLASNDPLNVEENILKTKRPFIDHPEYFETRGYYSAELILSGLAMDADGVRRFASTGKVVTDNYNILGTRSALSIENKRTITYNRIAQLILEHSPLFNKDSWVYNDIIDQLRIPYLSSQVKNFDSPTLFNALHAALAINDNPGAYTTLYTLLENKEDKTEARQALFDSIAVKTLHSDQQKYMLLKTYLRNGELSGLDDKTNEVLVSLSAAAKFVVESLKYLDFDSEEITSLRQNDLLLSRVNQTDQWYVPSLKLRAIWRSRLAMKLDDKDLANQSIELLKKVLVNSNELWVYEVRLMLGAQLKNTDIVLTSLEAINASSNYQLSIFNKLDTLPKNFDLKSKLRSIRRVYRIVNNFSDSNLNEVSELRKSIELTKSYLLKYEELQKMN